MTHFHYVEPTETMLIVETVNMFLWCTVGKDNLNTNIDPRIDKGIVVIITSFKKNETFTYIQNIFLKDKVDEGRETEPKQWSWMLSN